MKILNLRQGTAEWMAHRRTAWNASDAPAMMGESPHCTRAELLRRMATGIAPDVDAGTQRRFDAGHQVEALLRQHAEKIIGEPMHPFVGVADFDERYSASFDGCTFVGDEVDECKLLNARLRAAFADMESIAPEHRERSAAKCLPIDYRLQMEQQARIAEADRVLFLAGELRNDGTLGDVFTCWYYPDDTLWMRIRAGWEQFAIDLAAYVPPTAAAPVLVAAPVQALPAVSVLVAGNITVTDNFKTFETALRDFLEHRLIREPKTDQDFADLDQQIKAMKGAEAALDAAETQMLAQIEAVDTAAKAKAMLSKLVRDNRLMAEKLLASEKERRRGEIMAGGQKALQAHIEALHARLGKPYLPLIPADFAGAVRGLKSVASMEDKVATELARAKIAANEAADRISVNLAHLEKWSDFYHLFPDTAGIVLKAPEDLQALVAARIAQHKAAEQRRAEELAEKERGRIRAEEQARADREAQARAAEERRQREEDEAEARRAEQAKMTHTNGAPMFSAAVKENGDRVMLNPEGGRSIFCDIDEGDAAPAAAPIANVVPMRTAAPVAPKAPASISITALNDALGLNVTAGLLEKVGFTAASVQGKAGKFYSPDDLAPICTALSTYLLERARFFQQQQAA